MAFKKCVLVVKDVRDLQERPLKALSGIARIEIDGGVAEFFLSLINLPAFSNASFHALVVDQTEKNYFFELGDRPYSVAKSFHSLPKIDSGVAVGVYVVKNDIPITLAFARSDDKAISLSQFKKIVAERQLEIIKSARAKNLVEQKSEQSCPLNNQVEQAYDDEAVATVNYFEFDGEIKDKLKKVKELESNVSTQNELPDKLCEKETEKKCESFNSLKDETNACASQNNKPTFYLSNRQELEQIFIRFPEEQPLQKIFADSRWARINYSKDKYYVVGVIKEEGVEKYICYGVPANYSPTPPEQLKGYCSFVPASIFNMTGAGYWMLFQDAFSGKCVLHE